MQPSTHTPVDPYLTIVPDDAFVDADVMETIVDVTDEAERRVRPAPPLPEEPFSIAPAAKREAAPPRRTSKLVVAGALGGGMFLGGGVMAAIGLVVVLGIGALGAAGGAAWWWASSSPTAVEAPVVAPLDDEDVAVDEAPLGEDEAPEEAVDAPAAPPSDASPEPVDAAPEAAPSAPTPAPAAPPAVAPVAPDVAADEVPADDMLIKLLSDPPAASVTIDGRPMGRTPLKAFLPPGDHTVVIESGKASGQFTIDPMSDERVCFKAKGRKVQLSSCR